MIIRKLKMQEHECTRELWNKIFHEDGQEFLDYYYTYIASNNEIYVVEMDGDIRSMLHLNPYMCKVGKKEMPLSYIVGVATDPGYRKRGQMKELLRKAVRDMYHKNMPFTFLMPAAQAIYYPHGFRFIYNQEQWEVVCDDSKTLTADELCRKSEGQEVVLRKAVNLDCKKMAAFAEEQLSQTMHVYTTRDMEYYDRMLKEQESQNGGILLAEKDGEICGMVLYDEWEGFHVREPLGSFEGTGLYMCVKKKKPMIMARILHVETLLTSLRCEDDLDLQFQLVDPIIRENNKVFIVKGNADGIVVRTKPVISGKKQDIQLISADALTSILFGYKELEKIEEEEKEYFSEEFKEQIRKIKTLNPVFINEIV